MNKKYKDYCYEGDLPSIIINKTRVLTKDQTFLILKALYSRIMNETSLDAIDSNSIGNKYTTCTWGVCTEDPTIWNKPEYHTFPKDFDDYGRITHLQLAEGIDCPMRKRNEDDSENVKSSGCFYQCRVFQKNLKTPTKEEASQLYRDMLSKLAQITLAVK